MNIIMRDDTEHGIEYVKADEVRDYLNKAIGAEREACAQICEPPTQHNDPLTAWKISLAIRARGNP